MKGKEKLQSSTLAIECKYIRILVNLLENSKFTFSLLRNIAR